MKSVSIPGGVVHISECNAVCHFCGAAIEIAKVEEKLYKSKNAVIRHKCRKCKKFIGITSNYMGDIVSYPLGL